MKYFIKILATLLACVLLPCITVVFATTQAFSGLYEDSINNSQLNRLRSVSNTNSINIYHMSNNAHRIAVSSLIQKLGRYPTLDAVMTSDSYPTIITETMTSLQQLINNNELIESVYLYVNDSDYIVSSRNGVVKYENFRDLSWMEKYLELREDRTANRMMSAHVVYASYGLSRGFDNYGRLCVSYIYPITLFTSVFDGAIVFNMYEDKLLDLYTADSPDSNIAVFDQVGTLITGAGSHDYMSILNDYGMENVFSAGSAQNGNFVSTISGEKYLCSWYKSYDENFVFLIVDNMGTLMEMQRAFQFKLLIIILILVPIVSLAVFFISRRLYSPIGNLVKELRSNSRLDLSGEKDDLSAISRTINELLWEDLRLFGDSKSEDFLNSVSRQLLESSDETTIISEKAKVIMPYSCNICILASLYAPDDGEKSQAYETRLRLFSRLMQEEFSGEHMRSTTIQYDSKTIVAILSVDEIVDNLKTLIFDKITALHMEEIIGYSVAFAVGSISDDFASIHQSFDEAKAAVQYRFIKGLNSIIFYDDISDSEHFGAEPYIANIQSCLYDGKKDETIAGLNKLISDMQSHSNISFTGVTQVLNTLLNELVEYAAKNNLTLDELLKDNAVVYHSLWLNSTLKEAGEWLCNAFAAVIDYRNIAEDAGCEYVKQTVEFVKANYAKDITIDSIASHIGISYSYLRKVFKDATGSNLADYINDLRMQKAKELLCSTNYTIKEIAAMCGYNHERSFSRSFAHAEGMSPGKYKSQYKNNS